MISKFKMFFNKHGFIKTVKQVFNKINRDIKKIPYIVKESIKKESYIDFLCGISEGKEIYIFIPSIDWHIPAFQRPHQLATNLSKRSNTLVLFVSDQYKYDAFSFYSSISPTLYLYSIRQIHSLNKILNNANSINVIMTWPNHALLLDKFYYNKLVYEYIDNLDVLYYIDEKMEKQHIELLKKAHLVTVSADELLKDARKYSDKVLLSENAVDVGFFYENRETPLNPDLLEKISSKPYDTILGYYGSLASWFDYAIINTVATKKPNWLFVIIGHNFDGTMNNVKKLDNILLVEAQPYKKLPSFVAGFTIAIIPFVINDITKATSPVKLFEYMASQKPILSSDLPECRKYKSVLIYQNADDFIQKAEYLSKLVDNEEYKQLLLFEAEENTWEKRVNQILIYLGEKT